MLGYSWKILIITFHFTFSHGKTSSSFIEPWENCLTNKWLIVEGNVLVYQVIPQDGLLPIERHLGHF
jgi:hypothetical protein